MRDTRDCFSARAPCREEQPSGTADEPASQKNEHSANNYLKRRLKEGRVHILVANETDNAEFNRHNDDRNGGRETEIRNEKGKGVTQSAGRGHESRDRSANPGRAAARQRAVVRKRLREPHRNAC